MKIHQPGLWCLLAFLIIVWASLIGDLLGCTPYAPPLVYTTENQSVPVAVAKPAEAKGVDPIRPGSKDLLIKQRTMKTLSWKGYDWEIRQGVGGPGPNNWNESNVVVNAAGHLRLTITKKDNAWYTAQISTKEMLGYGTYCFTLETPVVFDPNIVFAGFTYLDDENEIDIEYTKWGLADEPENGQFTVQPYEASDDQLLRFSVPPTERGLVHCVQHFPDGAINLAVYNRDRTKLFEQWVYGGKHLPQEKAKWMFNLWLVKGKPPMDGKEVEVVISDFSFTSYNPTTDALVVLESSIKQLREELGSQRKLGEVVF